MQKKNIVIVGASGHAKVLIDILEKNKTYTIVGLIDSYKDKNRLFFGYTIIGTENDIKTLSEQYNFKMGIIAVGDNCTRKKLYKNIKKELPEFEYINAIHPSAILGKNVQIGYGNAIMAGAIVNSDSRIGNFCIINTNASLGHDGTIKDFCSLAPNATLGGNVHVGKCTAVSLGANIIQDISIGNYTIIGAGSLVIRDVGNFEMVYGVPAKKIRDIKKGEKYLYKKINHDLIENTDNHKIQSSPKTETDQKYSTTKEINTKDYTLICFDLKTNKDIEDYKKRLKNFEGYDAFYKIELLNIKNTQKDQLKYFILKKNEEVLVLMPFSFRKIIIREKDTGYYDVSSFYGYSGPLLNDQTTQNDLLYFWELADNWYKKHKVISEFIRFNLEGNHANYSGYINPTLNNVKGEILKNEEEQWSSFPSKVRNNYRKANKNGLTAKTFHGIIGESTIEIFHSIYINTMERNNAENDYFFSLDYFKNLLLTNPNNNVLIIIYKEETPISAELILLNKNTMYSFLGGTVSEFFHLRPNDFLKIEAMKWGRAHGFIHYILGGGRVNNDTLYKYKKSFFPNNDDLVYYTGRKILNSKIYEKLVSLNTKTTYHLDDTDILNKYFPLYRKEQKIQKA